MKRVVAPLLNPSPKRGALRALVVIAPIVAYLPVLATYAFADDYAQLAWADQAGSQMHLWSWTNILEGRPLTALLMPPLMRQAYTIPHLSWLRALALLGLALVALLLFEAWQRCELSPAVAATAAVLVVLTPPFQVWAAWAACALDPIGAALAVGAGIIVLGRRVDPGRWVGATLLLLGSCFLYQPSVTLFWVAVAPKFRRWDGKFALRSLGSFAAALVGDFAAARLGALLSPHLTVARAIPVHNLVQKVSWFLHGPLVVAVNLWRLPPSVPLALVVELVLAAGLWSWLPGTLRQRSRAALGLMALVPLAYAPNLAVASNAPAYRSEVGLTGLLALYATLAAAALCSRACGRRVLAASRVLVAAGVAGLMAVTGLEVRSEFVVPQRQEFEMVRLAVRKAAVDNRPLYFIPATWNDSAAPFELGFEFGLPSSVDPWTRHPMVYFAARQDGVAAPRTLIAHADIAPPRGFIVLDLRRLRAAGRGR